MGRAITRIAPTNHDVRVRGEEPGNNRRRNVSEVEIEPGAKDVATETGGRYRCLVEWNEEVVLAVCYFIRRPIKAAGAKVIVKVFELDTQALRQQPFEACASDPADAHSGH